MTRALLALVLVLSVLLVCVQTAFAAGPQITGKVTSAVTKAPLEGVEVCEYPIEGGSGDACAQTGVKGEYALAVGRAGEFDLYFDTTVKGLIPRTFYDEAFVGRQAKPVKVGEGATVLGVDEAIEEGGHITGRVLNGASKSPIEGIEACAQLPDVDQTGIEPHLTCSTTDAEGDYAIDGLPPGESRPAGGYEVEFTGTLNFVRQYYSGKLERYSGTRIPIIPGETVSGIDAELEEGGEISGRVTSQVDGGPIAGAQACAAAFAMRTICTKTNAAGEYTITQLTSREYTVSFSGPEGLQSEYISQAYKEKESPNAEPVSVTAPQKTSGIDASLKAYGRIAGTVIDKSTKKPVKGVNVCLSGSSCENTNAAGEYSFSKLTAGTYALDFYAFRLNEELGTNYLSQYEANEYIVEEELKARNPEAAHISVTMGGLAQINDELEQGGRITGTMLEAGTKQPASLWPCAEDLSTGHPANAKVCPNSMSGDTYTISGLPPGRYRVVFGASLPAYYFTQYYDDKDLESEAQEVAVASGETVKEIDASLIANPDPWEGAIAGKVIDASSQAALAGIEACAFDAHTTTAADSCVRTNAGGEYLLVGLKNGEYEVEFRSPSSGTLDYIHQRYEAGKAVTVVWGSITPSINGQLHDGGAIAGTVRNATTTQPASGVSVCAYNGSGESGVCSTSEAGGGYRLPGLPAGSYTVGFETTDADGHYFPQYFEDVTAKAQARGVPVEVGKTAVGIDASLLPNGHPGDGAIAGVLSDASTHAPLGGIEVCAYAFVSEELLGECTISTADGHYLLTGLLPGEYELEFSTPPNGSLSYVRTLYEGGRLVTVLANEIAAGYDAQLKLAGRLTGTITSAVGGHPAQGILACAFDEAQEIQACAPSAPDGSYAITGLAPGRYTVGFDGGSAGFAVQYYDETDFSSTAQAITLSAGQTVGEIDARLQLGGSVSGIVTNGLTGRPMEDVLVCALTPEEAAVECSFSEAGGKYTIAGIPPGDWLIGFDAGLGYGVQYYDRATEASAAKLVPIGPGAAVSGIDATMLTGPGKPVLPPLLSPVTPPHETLVTPAPSTPAATPAPTETGPSSSVLGSTFAKLAASVALQSSRITLSGRSAAVHVICHSAACSGSLLLALKVAVAGRSHGRPVRRVQTIALGHASFTLASGAGGAVHVHLTRAAASRLAHARRRPLAATLSITLAGGASLTQSVRIG